MDEMEAYKNVISKMKASEETYNAVLQMNRKETSKNHIQKKLLLAAVISSMLLLIGCTYIRFVVYNNSSGMLEALMGINGRSEYAADYDDYLKLNGTGNRTALDNKLAKKFIEPYIYAVEESITDGNTTLTVEAFLVDRPTCTAALYMIMENPGIYVETNRGQVYWDPEIYGEYYPFHTVSPIGCDYVIGNCMIVDALTTEDTLHFIYLFTCMEECEGVTVKMDGGNGECIQIDFPAQTKMPYLILDEGNIMLSPFAVKLNSQHYGINFLTIDIIYITYDDGEQYLLHWEDPILRDPETGREYEFPKHVFDPQTKKSYVDGVEAKESIQNANYSCFVDTENSECVWFFNRVVDLEKVKSITINGVEYFAE